MAAQTQHSGPVEFVDLPHLRVEQAKLLHANAPRSALPVLFIIANCTLLLLVTGHGPRVFLWTAAAMLMVAVTLVYPKLVEVKSLDLKTYQRYLNGHIAITVLTGLVWSLGGIFLVQPDRFSSLIVATLPVFSITLGGLFPSSIYRPGYVALASSSLLPIAFYLLFQPGIESKLGGMGLIGYLAFGMLSSARTEIAMRDTLLARLQRSSFQTIFEKNQQVEALLEEKSRFVASISHDLTQPMRASGNFIQLLRQRTSDPKQLELIEKLEMTTQNQQTMLEDLIERNKRNDYALAPDFAEIELEATLGGMVHEFETMAQARGLSFEVELCPEPVVSDGRMLARIIRNLLSNAMNYTPAGGKIQLNATPAPDGLQITVGDNGPGIAPEDQKRIFEENVRLDSAKHLAGSGLGLAIAMQLSKALGGQLVVDSQLGEGTRISLTIPNRAADGAKLDLTVLVIGEAEHTDFGDWMTLLSGWRMQALIAQNIGEAKARLLLLDEKPQIVILTSDFADVDQARHDLDKLLADHGPVEGVIVIPTGQYGIDLRERLGSAMKQTVPQVTPRTAAALHEQILLLAG